MKVFTNPPSCGVFFGLFKKVSVIFFLILAGYACSDADEIGYELIESPVQLVSTDTLSLKTYTRLDDSVATSLGWQNILGLLNDPVFGRIRSGIYTETRLPSNDLYLGDNPILDSIQLVLSYSGVYHGEVEGLFHTLQVYEITESLPLGDTLFSNREVAFDPTPLTWEPEGFRLRPAPTDSVMVDTIIRPPHIRIRLSEEFGQQFIDANGTPAFENVPNYREAFKGLYLKVDDLPMAGVGALYNINMNTVLTSLQMFYHEEGDTVQKMVQFPINEFAPHFTRVEYLDRSMANESFLAQIDDPTHHSADSILFLHSLGISRVHLNIPFLDELTSLERVVINRAELVVPVAAGFDSEELPYAENLLLLRIREDESLFFLTDFHVGRDYFGGMLDPEENQYVFNISQYLQEVMDGVHENHGLTLLASNAAEVTSRVVLHGPGRQQQPMRFIIYYTVF